MKIIYSFIFLLLGIGVTPLAAQYQLKNAYPGLRFEQPVEFLSVVDNETERIFIVEQAGKIRTFLNDSLASSSTVFLDISSKIITGGERGLLGMTVHPDYLSNGYFYVNYTRAGDGATVIARYTANVETAAADPSTELILLTVAQPFANHNGGKVEFGPDGYLYIALGDGGSAGDPQNNGQRLTTLLGKILRIDVNSATSSTNYGIPVDNPFAGNTSGWEEEIYAYGLRNPWKFSFDTLSSTIWAADVGQNGREEINKIIKGGNFGWRVMEGTACFNPSANCNQSGLSLPVWEYTHASGAGSSITGGYVYRGKAIGDLYGKYIYGDFASGNIWELDLKDSLNPVNRLLINTELLISAFGKDHNNEIYVCSYRDGTILRLINPTLTSVVRNFDLQSVSVFPNPAADFIHLQFGQLINGTIVLNIYDITGKVYKRLINNKVIIDNKPETIHDISDIKAGIYMYEVMIENYRKTGRLLVVK